MIDDFEEEIPEEELEDRRDRQLPPSTSPNEAEILAKLLPRTDINFNPDAATLANLGLLAGEFSVERIHPNSRDFDVVSGKKTKLKNPQFNGYIGYTDEKKPKKELTGIQQMTHLDNLLEKNKKERIQLENRLSKIRVKVKKEIEQIQKKLGEK